jgi:hypothetical protein
MKKLIQIALVLILVCGLFQTAADGSMASANETGSSAVSATTLSREINAAGVHATACLVRIKGVICVTPDVGWNT